MNTRSRNQIIEYINKKGKASASLLVSHLRISPQAVHRHLKALCAAGVLKKQGRPPHSRYHLDSTLPVMHGSLQRKLQQCKEILAAHPAICLVTLFGSQARNEATDKSDIDLLIWINEFEFTRLDIWAFWDRHSRHLPWRNQVSLVVRKMGSEIFVDTLLLDLPEEHVPIFDSKKYFPVLRDAVIQWRKKWSSKKLPSYGGKHGWKYSTTAKCLDDIDFRLELENVA